MHVTESLRKTYKAGPTTMDAKGWRTDYRESQSKNAEPATARPRGSVPAVWPLRRAGRTARKTAVRGGGQKLSRGQRQKKGRARRTHSWAGCALLLRGRRRVVLARSSRLSRDASAEDQIGVQVLYRAAI